MKPNRKGFTILELLVVVAIIAILAMIAIPNFIGRIDEAKDSRELAEINAVSKAVAAFYADKGYYPTLQRDDGSLLQAQPVEGAPHNVKFAELYPDYLASLPHFSYWWVDYQGKIYHTENPLGTVTGNTFTPTSGYSFKNSVGVAISGVYTVGASEFITGKDSKGRELPKLGLAYKNEKMHPEDHEYVSNRKPVAVLSVTPSTGIQISTALTWSYSASTDPDGDTIIAAEWQGKQASYATPGLYEVKLRVKDSNSLWSDWVSKTIAVDSATKAYSTESDAWYTVSSTYASYDTVLALVKGGRWFADGLSGTITLDFINPKPIKSIGFETVCGQYLTVTYYDENNVQLYTRNFSILTGSAYNSTYNSSGAVYKLDTTTTSKIGRVVISASNSNGGFNYFNMGKVTIQY